MYSISCIYCCFLGHRNGHLVGIRRAFVARSFRSGKPIIRVDQFTNKRSRCGPKRVIGIALDRANG